MILYATGSENHRLSADDIRNGLIQVLHTYSDRQKVLVIPPDITRFHSRAGEITCMALDYLQDRIADILPALGTHRPMTEVELTEMFPGIPHELFRVHDWRHDVVTLGEVPESFVAEVSEGTLHYGWPVQLNRMIPFGGHDLILSVGQVVPHEVIGMANYNKNILIGCGGPESINKSHFLGAVYGMERIMGIASNPVRKVLNQASETFLGHLPIVYVLTVLEQVTSGNNTEMVTRGLIIGTSEEVFDAAAELSVKVNIKRVKNPLKKVVVYLDPGEYRSTWLGNKSIYRTRMAIAYDGDLIVLAPGVREFGEDPVIDLLIRKYGYHGTSNTLTAVNQNDDLRKNLSAAAHLIHGSSEGRFRITYCPGHLTREEVENVGFQYGDLEAYSASYLIQGIHDGFNTDSNGEEFFFISNPATGLWSCR